MAIYKQEGRHGFTIVELLIVVVIIAILAAITIVAYNGLQQRARASAASSAVSQAKKKLELYKVDNSTYPATGSLAIAGITDSNDTTYQYTATNNNTNFCLTATTANVSYYINDTTTSSPTAGGCPGPGQGGVVAVTNLAPNPSVEANFGWISNNGSLWSKLWDSSKAHSGTHSMSSENLTTSNNTLLSLYSVGAANGSGLGFPVAANTTYTNAIYFTADVAHQGQLGCTFRANNVWQAGSYSAWYTGVVGSWTRAQQTCTSPAGADMMRVVVYVNATSAQPVGTRAYVDDIITVVGSTAPAYADGNSPNWVWNGTANASTSTGPAL